LPRFAFEHMTPIADLVSKHGHTTRVEVALPRGLASLAESRPAEAFICSTEQGFSPLGVEHSFLCEALDVPWDDIYSLADWNRFENEQVSLVIIPSRRLDSVLKGLILAASERSRCYMRFAEPDRGRVHRDFFYNVTYEAIAFAHQRWNANRLAVSHLTGCVGKPRDVEALACNLEALAHYCDENPDAKIDHFSYAGCCVSPDHFATLPQLTPQFTEAHCPITVNTRQHDGYEVVDLTW